MLTKRPICKRCCLPKGIITLQVYNMFDEGQEKKREYIRDGRAPIPLKESTSRVMSANRGKNTSPEMVLRRSLNAVGIRNYRLHNKKLPGKPDIAFPRAKLAVFVNGCFWHRCPYCKPSMPKSNVDFWKTKFKKNKARDRKKKILLEKMGWKVIVVWECQIKDHLPEIANMIKDSITQSDRPVGESGQAS